MYTYMHALEIFSNIVITSFSYVTHFFHSYETATKKASIYMTPIVQYINIYIFKYIHTYTYIHIYICICTYPFYISRTFLFDSYETATKRASVYMTLIIDSFTPNGRASYELNHQRSWKPLMIKSQVSIFIFLFFSFFSFFIYFFRLFNFHSS
jgi:hypothetical protein